MTILHSTGVVRIILHSSSVIGMTVFKIILTTPVEVRMIILLSTGVTSMILKTVILVTLDDSTF